MKDKLKFYINAIFRRTYWYQNVVFGDCWKLWHQRQYNLDLVNLGSGAAKYGFDYSGINLKTANWAMAPQTFVGDYAVLANFLSYLKPEGAVVLMTICPFSCLDDGKRYLPDKMYTIADMISIPDFSIERKMKMYDLKKNPIKYFPLVGIFSEIKHFFLRNRSSKMTSEQLKISADGIMNSWMKQFSLYDLSYEFSLVNRDRFEMSVKAFDKLVSLCVSHNFIPVLILPPVSKYLLEYFDKDFQQRYIYDYLNSSNHKDILFLNYLGDEEFDNDSLYRNANFLNPVGAKKFTDRVIEDLKKAGVLGK